MQIDLKKRLSLVLVAGCLTFATTATPGLAQQGGEPTGDTSSDEEMVETARLHFKNGVELLQSEPPNYQDAFRQFELALEQLRAAGSDRSWKVLGNLGLCALKLERDGEALAYYSEYLETGGENVDPRERATIERELLLLRGNMTTVTIASSDPNARISVRRQGSSAPTQLYSLSDGEVQLGLRAGSLVITARGEKGALTWEPVLSPGEKANHTFDFDAQEPAPAPAGVSPAATPEGATSEAPEAKRGPSGTRIAGYATAGVGLVALGVGGVLGLSSQNKEKSAEDECIESVCQTATEDEFDSAKQSATTANILFIAGGVLTATGVTLVILGARKGPEKGPSSARLQLSPLASPSGGGLFARGSF